MQTGDLAAGLLSLLDGQPIDVGKANISQYPGNPSITPRSTPRAWLAAPLREIFTLTNLRGVPYKLPFSPDREEVYVDHADYIRYAITYDGQQPPTLPRPDELQLDFGAGSAANWTNFAQFACGTAAFPAGFPPRTLSRPTVHYRYRVVRRAPDDLKIPHSGPEFEGLEPDWLAIGNPVPDTYDFITVDGGATDNEPIELARTVLCGVGRSNPRKPKKANRAVLLIDPFAGKNDLGPSQTGRFVTMLGAIVSGVIQQTRYDTRDVVLAADPTILSRRTLTVEWRRAPPCRLGGDSERRARRVYRLRAFIVHASRLHARSRELRRVPAPRLHVAGRWRCHGQTMDRRPYRCLRSTRQPARSCAKVGGAAMPQPVPTWPAEQLNPENYRHDIERRFRGVLGTFGFRGKAAAAALQLQCAGADYAIDAMKAYLSKAHL